MIGGDNLSNFAFQGSLKKKHYFEGWYYKNVTVDKQITVSIIPGVALTEEDPHAFIQVIENVHHKSYYIRYDINEVLIHHKPECIQIADNYFYEDYIDLNIQTNELVLTGFLYYSDFTRIKTSRYAPTIMGPFSYLPFMECNHSIISMHHYIDGILFLNDQELDFEDGYGYIEKDYGTSFPSEYLWLQSNTLARDNLMYKKVSLFLSQATIPFKLFQFNGFIAVFTLNDKEYRFSTYQGSKCMKKITKDETEKITLKNRQYKLVLKIQPQKTMALRSPKSGKMDDEVLESLDSICQVTLYQKKKVLFQQKLIACGYEKKK